MQTLKRHEFKHYQRRPSSFIVNNKSSKSKIVWQYSWNV